MNRHDRQRGDFDGVRVTAHPRRMPFRAGLVLVAVVLAISAGWWLTLGHTSGADGGDMRPDAASSGRTVGHDPAGPETAEPDDARNPRGAGVPTRPAVDGEDPTLDLSDYVLPGEAPEMAQVIEALHARGIRTGLGAFPPPGTSPPLEGLEVPEDFPLPEGYVRHHQATDGGQRIAPILMFAPDLDSIVVRGARVPVPADRVVPPELAPPGMPLRRVRIPPPDAPGGGG